MFKDNTVSEEVRRPHIGINMRSNTAGQHSEAPEHSVFELGTGGCYKNQNGQIEADL